MEETNATSTRTYLLWGAAALGLTLIIVLIASALTRGGPASAPAPTPTLPVSLATSTPNQAGGGSYTVPISNGASVVTRDFLHDTATIADPHNPGYYYLGYHQSTGLEDTTATADPPYVIEYIAQTHYFNIGLNQEPIGQVRQKAEQYLLNTLGITTEEACTLKYMLSVPEDVNSYYAGQNLGFSFCPGAVKLPE